MTSIKDLINVGGPVVWILAAMSLVALTVFFYKIMQLFLLRRINHTSPSQALNLLEQGKNKESLMMVKGSRNPRAQILTSALNLIEQNMLDSLGVQKECLRRARLMLLDLGSYLRVLEVIAMVAPLLGLFGTVLGMIEAFQGMEAAGSRIDPSVLSGGIWQALLTTAVGLAVAIPASLLHSWLERRIEVESLRMEDDIQRIFTWADQYDSVAELKAEGA